jgi:hypothetical protein
LEEIISISFNDSNENLLSICDVSLRQRSWGGTGHFGITIADGVRNACWDNYAVDC